MQGSAHRLADERGRIFGSLGKPLFASENGSQDYNNGAAAMARADNRDYLDGKMTATINWPVIAAISPGMPYNTDGLLVANQPWSGWYSLGKALWVTAQTTQPVQVIPIG